MKRRKFTPEFKRRVALEALRSGETERSVATRHGIDPGLVGKWRTEAKDGLLEVFARPGRNAADRETERLIETLHARIGELTAERDFLSKGLKSPRGSKSRG